MACAMLMTLPSCANKKAGNATADEATQTENVAKPKKNYKVNTLPITVTSKILETIKENYKGKVVLFDVWATWCGPCRMAMASIDSIKPELEKKGVKFVYITGETSPLDTWNSMIQKIDGDHYRLTKAQWAAIGDENDMRGIPCYAIINKDGTTAFSNLSEGGYPGNEFIKNALEEALKKK